MVSKQLSLANAYAATCAAGLEEVVESYFAANLSNFRLLWRGSGLLIFRTKTDLNQLKQFPILKNLFWVTNWLPNTSSRSLDQIADSFLKAKLPELDFRKDVDSFRVFVSWQNQPKKLAYKTLSKLEFKFSKWLKAVVNRARPQAQVWVWQRQEGFALLAIRLTNQVQKLSKGELSRDIAEAMVYLSQPEPTDICLDPFAGHGALARVRLIYPLQSITNLEIDPSLCRQLKREFARQPKLKIRCQNFLEASPDQFPTKFNRVVTDPPWGYFDRTITDLDLFYEQFLEQILRVTTPAARLVFLIGDRLWFEREILPKFDQKLQVLEKHYLLVSGKKAAILVLQKAPD